ncbi:MAG: hypothetical protein NC218_06780 [Acetobacter sp.]|nr:hypothetical protein [Acetobacter sp.]
MKANVYTGFLTDKIKIYDTKKDCQPKKVSGRKLYRAFPLLLSSLMVSPVSCLVPEHSSQNGEDAHKITWFAPDVASKDDTKEFLSDAEVKKIIANPCPTPLKDINFNHLPEHQENFWEIVLNGVAVSNEVQRSSRLSAEQKAEYRITTYKMLSQISRIKGSTNDVDVRDFNNLKTFLYFEKMVRYKDKYAKVLGQQSGVIDERCALFGRYYQDQENLKTAVEAHSGVKKFAKALYGCDERFVLSYNDSIQANKMSREILADWLAKQQVNDDNLWYYVKNDEYDYCNTLVVYTSRGNPVRVQLGVDPTGDLGDGCYSPVGSTLIHELMHLGQKKPSSKEKPEDNQKDDGDVKVRPSRYDDYTMELGPTLYSLAIEDQMYKKIHGIDQDAVVDYGDIDFGTHRVSVGKTAVWFRKMIEKYPSLSVDKVLTEPEVLEYMEHLGNNAIVQHMQQVRGGR